MEIKKVIELLKRFPEDSQLISADWSPGYQIRVKREHLKHHHTYFMDFALDASDEWLEKCLK